jgi:hypothetical protein
MRKDYTTNEFVEVFIPDTIINSTIIMGYNYTKTTTTRGTYKRSTKVWRFQTLQSHESRNRTVFVLKLPDNVLNIFRFLKKSLKIPKGQSEFVLHLKISDHNLMSYHCMTITRYNPNSSNIVWKALTGSEHSQHCLKFLTEPEHS